ncbi:hypothetical protein ACFV4K_07325 [Nocardia sp. NPDC059764]|uniref:hypothetical protein n=1 Tax=Nocardia sp. NPDC059764 TaxID=3346939 RepID=UPI0036657191
MNAELFGAPTVFSALALDIEPPRKSCSHSIQLTLNDLVDLGILAHDVVLHVLLVRLQDFPNLRQLWKFSGVEAAAVLVFRPLAKPSPLVVPRGVMASTAEARFRGLFVLPPLVRGLPPELGHALVEVPPALVGLSGPFTPAFSFFAFAARGLGCPLFPLTTLLILLFLVFVGRHWAPATDSRTTALARHFVVWIRVPERLLVFGDP